MAAVLKTNNMAFKMNKPSMIKGSKAHKKALQELNVNRTGYENLPDGRSKSSAFQQRELTPEEMQAQLDAADKMQVNVAADTYKSEDLGSGRYETSMLDYTNEDGTINEQQLFNNMDNILKDADPEESKKLLNQFAMETDPSKRQDGDDFRVDPNKLRKYVREYNNYIKVKPYKEEGYSFQDHQQKLADYEQEKKAEDYNKKLAVDLVRRGDYDTIEDAMNAINKG